MKYYFKLIINGLRFGIAFNLLTLVFIAIYTLSIEYYFRPFSFRFNPLIELGTAVSGMKIFIVANPKNPVLRPAWAKIQHDFTLFLPEFQLRADWLQPSPLLDKWCKDNKCCAHRIGFNDRRIRDYRCFTLDDWYLTNRDFLGSDLDRSLVSSLDGFLLRLPKGSRVIVNEPYMLFADRRSFKSFTDWFLALAAKHPALKFEIGIQIHLQWVDSYWWQYHGWLIPALGDFARTHRIRWGLSEFSIYNRLWKPRIAYGGATPERMRLIDRIESIIPDRFLNAVVAHQAYVLHSDALKAGATTFIEWGNFPTTWFAEAIDPQYKSVFALYDWNGRPQLMYWAIVRSLALPAPVKKP
jgi:hypothetical protein